MVAHINTVSFQGIDVLDIEVQVQISNGLPAFQIVGLPDKAVAESRERVRAALHAMGLSLPPKRLTVNLAPADVTKEGSHYDLPIALGVLAAMEVVPASEIAHYTVMGELGLDGGIRSVSGVLPAAMHANSNERGMICPQSCGPEAAWASSEMDIIAAPSLLSLLNHLKGTQVLTPPKASMANDNISVADFADVKGQETAKRALEIAAAGAHNILMIGPPGSGKSMLAARLPGILPRMDAVEALEISMIHSLAGMLPEGGIVSTRPFRDPHHSASLPALIGGGQRARPGEISLAHNGVLFLDELPEFSRQTVEALRQPVEAGKALVARVNHHVTYPARFQLVAAMNPCRCGHLDDPDLACTKVPKCALDYQSKISGPLFDRIDLHVDVPALSINELSAPARSEPSASIRARVEAARKIQSDRFKSMNAPLHMRTNNDAQGEFLEQITTLKPDAQALMDKAVDTLKLSARGYHRILRVGRTIADLAGVQGPIERAHIAEALGYRRIRPQ